MSRTAEYAELDWSAMQAALYRYCLSLTKSSWDAQDLSQTVWAKAYERIRGRGHANPEAFLLRIAKNAWIDNCRRKAAYKELLEGMLRCDDDAKGDTLELEHVFQALMKHLSPLQRTVFVLREALGYSIAETASGLGTTEGAIKAALYRARQSMGAVRDELERNGIGMLVSYEEQEKLREAAAALQEGQTLELVSLLSEGYIWLEGVRAVGWFQTAMPVGLQGYCAPNAMYMGFAA